MENQNVFYEEESNVAEDIELTGEMDASASKKAPKVQAVPSNPEVNQQSSSSSGIFTSFLGGEETIQNQFAREIAGQVYNKGRDRARTICDLYAHIDYIRPYFDVEPKDVAVRLFRSIIPELSRPKLNLEELEKAQEEEAQLGASFEDGNNSNVVQSSSEISHAYYIKKKADLYGPLMLSFTLSSILLLGLKLQRESGFGDHLQQGTLLSTALFIVFAFWGFVSALYYFLSFIFSSSLSLLEVFSSSGYAQFGICIALLSHCVISGVLDYTILIIFGGMSAISLAVKFFINTPKLSNALIFAAVTLLFQLCFVVYLKIFYIAISNYHFF